jgi:hypothetical protein
MVIQLFQFLCGTPMQGQQQKTAGKTGFFQDAPHFVGFWKKDYNLALMA